MNPICLEEIRRIVDGQSAGAPAPDGARITAVSTDTREMKPGAMFVALRGENHDGHDFLAQAAQAGAVAAMVQEQPKAQLPGFCLLKVQDTRKAMAKLARFVREQMKGKVIAVGGSNGKTGTKHLIDAALSTRLRGTIPPKSFNNDIGVPLTIFAADAQGDYLVLEMGTNHHGELRVLTEMARPDIAVITNCSAEHLEGLGDLAGVRREEASIIQGLKAEGLLVVNGDDPDLLDAVSGYKGDRVTFGLERSNDLCATQVKCDIDGVRFRVNGAREVFIPLLGRHVACNSLAAIAVGRRMGLSEEEIAAGLGRARGPVMRLQLQRAGGVTVLNDAYNANPASMRAALETFGALPTLGRRIAVLGDMRELGHASDQLHREMGRFVAALALDKLICVGAKAAIMGDEAWRGGFPDERIVRFADSATAAKAVAEWLVEGDMVVIKGSRSMQLERIADAIGGLGGRRAAS